MQRRAILSLTLAALLLTPLIASVGAQEVKRFRNIDPIPKPPSHFNVFVTDHVMPGPCMNGFVIEPLAFLNRDNGTWFPWIATDWELSEDKLTLTVHLRDDVTWTDGATLTSKDVLTTWYCLNIMKNWQWDYLESVEAPDDYTVIFHLKEPWIYTEYYLMQSDVSAPYSVYGNFSDAAQEAIEDGDTDRLSELLAGLTAYRPQELVTTGPFRFERLTTSDLLYVKRDEYWHGIDNIKFDEYLQIHLGTGPSEFAGILSRGGDLCSPDLTREIYEELQATDEIYVPVESWHHGQSLIFNTQKYPLSLVEVRRAIAYALDREEMSIAVSPHPDMALWPDYPTGMLVGDEYIWIDSDYLEEYFDKYEYNLDKAIEIFESLNFVKGADGIWVTPNGTRLEFDIISAPWTDWALSCENTKLQLAKAGIAINVYATEPITCVQVPAGDFDLAYFCILRRWLPLPTETFQYGFVISWAEGIGTYNKIYEVPEIGMVNATEWAQKLPTVFDEEEQKRIITALAYIANHYLPYYAMREKPCTYTYNVYDIVYPPEGDPWYKWAAYSLYDALGYYVLNGWIYPTPPEVVPPEEVTVEVVPAWVYAVAGVAVIAVVAAAIVVMTKRT